jgi:hypothetical protein
MKTAKDCEGCEAYMEHVQGGKLAELYHRDHVLSEEIIKVILEFRNTDAPLVDNIVEEIRARTDRVSDPPQPKAGG